MAKNANMTKAKLTQNDEHYTQLSDIENELKHYRKYFEGAIVFCNCDDPDWSNFWKFFYLNFDVLGLKKLISTHYDSKKSTYKMEYNGINDPVITNLEGNGDFRSQECIELLKEATIVVTNPPFSLFREYVAQLLEYKKNFLIIGNLHAITYKEFFPFLKKNMVWFGFNTVKSFIEPDGSIKKFGNIGWYTNLDHNKRHEELILYKKFAPKEYPKYDNYDAIEVGKVADIPTDYTEMMGVPISFLDKYCPEQFEIVGMPTASSNENSLNLGVDYSKYVGYRQDGTKTGRTGSTFGACPVFERNDGKGIYYTNGKQTVQAGSCERLFIRYTDKYISLHPEVFGGKEGKL